MKEFGWWVTNFAPKHSVSMFRSKKDESRWYLYDCFDVKTCFTNKYSTLNGNLMSRLRNSLANAIDKQPLLPKLIVIILNDDVMSSFPFGPQTLPKNVARILHWLMVEFDRLITTHKERLSQESKKAGYPCFIWVEAPQHENFNNNNLRHIFNDGLAIAGNLHENVSSGYEENLGSI